MKRFLFFIILFLSYKQSFACNDLGPDPGYTADNHYYLSGTEAASACASASSNSCVRYSGGGWTYYYYATPGVQHFYAYGCSLPPENCLQRPAKVTECGGADKVQCDDQCKCSCIDPCAQQKQAKATICGGIDNVECYDQCNCICKPSGPCAAQKSDAQQECGVNYTINEQTCVYSCGNCTVQRQELKKKCNYVTDSGNTVFAYKIDANTCIGDCDPVACIPERAALEKRCGKGNYLIDPLCDGECKQKCREEARAACGGHYAGPVLDAAAGMFPVKWYYEDKDSGRCFYECKCENHTSSSSINFDFQTCTERPSGSNCNTKELANNCSTKELATINWQTCEYTCKTCDTERTKCLQDCNPRNSNFQMCDESKAGQERRVTIVGTTIDWKGYCTCSDPSCEDIKADCDFKCSQLGGALYNFCEENNGIATRECECNLDSAGPDGTNKCVDYKASCVAACRSSECGGVNVNDCVEGAEGIIRSSCSCKTCGDPNVGISGGGNGNGNGTTPASNPSDSSDIAGWLKSSKENSDTMIGQFDDITGELKEQNGWLGKIERNTSDSSKKLSSINDGINGYGGVKDRLGGVNTRLDGVNDNLGDIKEGLSNVSIGAESEGLEELEKGDYGDGPGDDDLPTKQAFKNAFDRIGTFDPGESNSGYRGQVKTALEQLDSTTEDPVCSTEIALPWVSSSAKFSLDFCPYESYLVLFGNVLVVCVGLRELYMFS